jgi:hypothetical protein
MVNLLGYTGQHYMVDMQKVLLTLYLDCMFQQGMAWELKYQIGNNFQQGSLNRHVNLG